MKKYLHIALMLLCVFVVSSCKDDDDDTEAVEVLKNIHVSRSFGAFNPVKGWD